MDDERFWRRVSRQGERDGDCWVWQGYCTADGYGALGRAGRSWVAHRYAWTQVHGPIPPDQQVLHRCDNPPCVRPAHLFLGTPLVNARDRAAKGRNGPRPGFGKLTADRVAAIREALAAGLLPQRSIAADHRVSQATVSQIKRGRTWARR